MKTAEQFYIDVPSENIWQQILDWENLLLAYRKARAGKRHQAEIQRFTFNLEYELCAIRKNLRQHRYVPGGFRQYLFKRLGSFCETATENSCLFTLCG